MSAAQRKKKKQKEEKPPFFLRRWRDSVVHFVMTAGIVLLILYATLLAASHTDGFRAFFAERLGKRVGLSLTIGKMHADWRLDFHLSDVASIQEDGPAAIGIEAERATLRWSLRAFFDKSKPLATGVLLQGCHVVVAPSDGGAWVPVSLAPMSKWLSDRLGLEGLGVLPAGVGAARPGSSPSPETSWADGAGCRLEVQSGRVTWLDQRGSVVVRAEGLALTVSPLSVPGRDVSHSTLSVDEVTAGGRALLKDVHIETIRAGAQVFVLEPTAMHVDVTRDMPEIAGPTPGLVVRPEIPVKVEEDLSTQVRDALREALSTEGASPAD